MIRELLDRATELHRRHQAYVMATVVWARGPSSGKQGAMALIEADGAIHGWIGGACAEPAVLREARKVLKDGTATLMYLGPAEELDGHQRDGVITVPISCSSEGALEVFLEPVLPQPSVVVVGRSPAVKTLTKLLTAIDWRVTVVDDAEPELELSDDIAVVGLGELASLAIDDTVPIVVATQGHFDEPALEAALATESPYIGLVASKSRSETVLGYLRDKGHSDDSLRRIHTPAGLDLGAIEHREIGVAVLAELIAIKASGGIGGARAETPDQPETALDPVCGMTVDVADARFVSELDGISYYFCSPGCQQAFENAPAEFVS